MLDVPVVGICPTIYKVPQFENLRKVQTASFLSGDIQVIYAGEDWAGWMEQWTTQDKIVHLYEKVLEERKDVVDGGYIILLHHDVVLDDVSVLGRVISEMDRCGYAVAGTSENDGVMRNSYHGKHYCHSAFMVIDPRAVGDWYKVDEWIENGWIKDGVTYRLRGMDRYWKISHGVLGCILYLESCWRTPPLGKTTEIRFNGDLLATHLWLSTGDIRVRKKWRTIEGNDPVDVARWRREFCEQYARKYGVSLDECEDTVRSLDYYKKSWTT